MASKAVNRPTDPQQRDKDVNNKLQLYGIYSAFTKRKLPSNKQIDVALNSAQESKVLATPSKKLSPEGQKIAADIKDVIDAAKILILTKNEGNLFQDFIWQTQQISGGTAEKPNVPIDKQSAKQQYNEALEGLRTLGQLLITNGQFRKLLNDATILIRSMAGDAATKTAGKVNPTEDQLNQIDEAAADNTWHDAPDIKAMKAKAQERVNKAKSFGKKEADKAAGDATQEAHPEGSRDPTDAADLAAQDQQTGGTSGLDAASGAAAAGAQTIAEDAKEKIPEEKKDRAKEYRERGANYLKSKMPKERREQTIWRLKKMVVEVQAHQDYMRAIETLLRLAEEYAGHGKNLAGQGSGAVKGAHSDDSLQLAETDLRTLIERFANSTSLDDFFDALNNIYKDAEKDPELRGWFKHLDTYIRKCLKEQGFIMQDAATEEWNEVYDKGRFLLRDRYRNHTDRILDEIKFIGQQFDADPQNKAFVNSLNKLFKDLGQDESGKAAFKPHLLKDLSEVVLPGIFENIRYIPVPRIEYSDPQIDAIVENLVIEGDNLAPNIFEFASDNHWRWGRKKISNTNKNKIMLSVSGIQMDIRDVSYYVNKKQGFPSLKDQGVLDIFLGGEGFSFKVMAETADKSDKQHFFKVTKVDVDVKNFNIKLKKSSHKLLFTLVKPLLIKVIRPGLQKVLEQQIRQNFTQADAVLYSIHQEAERAKAEFQKNPDPENAQNLYQRYLSAVQKHMTEAKAKKEQLKQATSDKKANIAMTQHESIFKDIALPGGISHKATEFRDLASQGDKWESPVFSIGNAKETTNLPKIQAVTRKPHGANTGGIRGPGAGKIESGAANANGSGVQSQSSFSKEVNQAFEGGVNGLTTDGKP
ncbi:hypothetical protein IWZ03DRAFT_312135 [Phyllosticta citriasiana]|uniref:Uncharacterized protein n=1 Tax=Phyllosticta citriasiana TaxID=595635 RepID=A0ABR1KJS4_9PEZI